MENYEFIINIIGWIGALSLLSGYLLVSIKITQGNSVPYQLLSVMGRRWFIV